MKREFRKNGRIPAHTLSLDELELLVTKLAATFKKETLFRSQRISFPSRNSTIDFDTIAEMRNDNELPSVCGNYQLYLRGGEGTIFIFKQIFGQPAQLTVEGESLAWVAGTFEIANQFFSPRRRWYSWFRGWVLLALGTLSFLIGSLAIGVLVMGPKVGDAQIAFMAAPHFTIRTASLWWITLGSSIILTLMIFRGKLLPAASLRIRLNETCAKKYTAEISIGLGLATLIVALIELMVDFSK